MVVIKNTTHVIILAFSLSIAISGDQQSSLKAYGGIIIRSVHINK